MGQLPHQVDIDDTRFTEIYPSALLYREPVASNLITCTPLELYRDGNTAPGSTVRVGNGGAGYTGIIRELAEAYQSQRPASSQGLNIAWVPNHSRHSLVALLGGIVDIALTYEPVNEDLAIRESWARRVGRVFNDHFIVAGPVADPAGIGAVHGHHNGHNKIEVALRRLVNAGKAGRALWHSRGDGSATFTKERELFAAAGFDHVMSDTSWLHTHAFTPYEALQRANTDGAYLLTDRATFLTAQQRGVIDKLRIFVEGGLNLLNPCAAMVRIDASPETNRFAAWLCAQEATDIVKDYGKTWAWKKALFTVPGQDDFPDAETLVDVRTSPAWAKL